MHTYIHHPNISTSPLCNADKIYHRHEPSSNPKIISDIDVLETRDLKEDIHPQS
jgi:hypothetical protein